VRKVLVRCPANAVHDFRRGVLAVGLGASLIASRDTVMRNATGPIHSSGAVLRSRGDNTVVENTVNSSGVITPLGGL
jgi:hypothetical protein